MIGFKVRIFSPYPFQLNLQLIMQKIDRQGSATILLSKHISCTAIGKLKVGMELYF
jgi:hypothetical protein